MPLRVLTLGNRLEQELVNKSKRAFGKPEFNSIPLNVWPAFGVKMEAEVHLATLTARWRRERMLPFLTQPSAALVFSLSFTVSSETTGSHLTHFILFTKGVGPGLIVTAAASVVPLPALPLFPGQVPSPCSRCML